MDDLISRQAAIDAVRNIRAITGTEDDSILLIDKAEAQTELMMLPSAQPEIIRCKDCKYWREHKYAKETKRYIPFCGFNAIYTKADDFCSKGTRRTDATD